MQVSTRWILFKGIIYKLTRGCRIQPLWSIIQEIRVKYTEERNYFDRLSKGKRARWNEKYAAKFAIVSNIKSTPQEIYEIWKTRNGVEMAFDVLQNFLETDRPYVHKEEIFKGYLFCSFIGLIAYYHILKMLKDAKTS